MRKLVLSALAASVVAAPAPLLAQDEAQDEAPLALEEPGDDFSGMAERFKDPEQQRQMALMLRTMSEVLLDMPLAPLMEALNDVGGSVAGEDAPEVDPDATLRSMAPEADRVPEEIEKNLPRALDAMGSMAEAMEKMMPALKDMAERMKEVGPTNE
ncbi:hypothetical protein K3152_09330 [Qipengyuania sp. 1NDH17]|uniref:Uncharacterized protein n=1 Tax=Qipengyuania polymorpha TaxID=2867234 RepID=A0ABS7IY09_9SPHN|nr:hypothetical protein [Qipengyuania polymorpha]MBX7458446.1 hypothetical protein [Qipengyuania polymorpha]